MQTFHQYVLCFSTLQQDIVGHSGDSIEVPFVESFNPPAEEEERLQVLKSRSINK